MSIRICAIAENNLDIVNQLKKNNIFKNRVFKLNHCENKWHLSKNGLLLIDIDKYAYQKNEFGEDYASEHIPFINKQIEIKYNTEKTIADLGCSVAFIPNELIIKYFKNLAKTTKSKVGLMMLHERGDNFYDEWTWAFDYSTSPNQEFFSAVVEAIGECKNGYLYWELSACPFKLDSHYDAGHPMFYCTNFYNLFKIKWFPCITDILPLEADGKFVELIF